MLRRNFKTHLMEKCFVNNIFNLFSFLTSSRLHFYFITLQLHLKQSLVLMLKGHRLTSRRRMTIQQFTLQRQHDGTWIYLHYPEGRKPLASSSFSNTVLELSVFKLSQIRPDFIPGFNPWYPKWSPKLDRNNSWILLGMDRNQSKPKNTQKKFLLLLFLIL